MADDPFLGKGTITISEFVSSSPSLCAVSDFAKIHLDRRLTWGEDKETALNQVREIVDGVDAKVKLLNYSKTSYTGLTYGMEKYYPTWKIDGQNHPGEQSLERISSLAGCEI